MAVHFPFSDEKYMQLIAEGLSDKECAMRMHVKQSILVSEYLPVILRKAGLSTREEFVQHAQGGSEREKGVPAQDLNAALRGVKMAQARAFYRSLEQHFFQNDCQGCKSYKQYGVLLVKGQFYQHMVMISPVEGDVFVLISSLKESGLIELRKDNELYRVTFKHLLSKEGQNDGDNNI
jgi:hypothetical protein